MSYEDILPLRARPVPPEVYRVEGCDCGGGPDIHLVGCSISDLPPEQQLAARDDAERRIQDHIDELNRKLHAALARGA